MAVSRDAIFKGCTRPAMKMGVPLVPLIFVFMACFLVGVWGGFLLGIWPVFIAVITLVVAIVTMRGVAKKDDQRFRQVYLWLLLRVRNKNRSFWQATSYSPTRFKSRK